MKTYQKIFRNCAITLFISYILFLILVIVLKYPTGLVSGAIKSWQNGVSFKRLTPQMIPFKNIIFYVKRMQVWHDWFGLNLACNVLMFIPYGILLPVIKKNHDKLIRTVLLSGCIFSICIEIFQYITGFGLCDIDDVIMNTLGVGIGFTIYKLVEKLIEMIKNGKKA